ncbi:MAG: BamA/TamA family outer membrane protein [Balneolaceae bacterium]
MKKLRLLFIVFLFAGHELPAQGFNSTNGRNHPELDWQTAETEHFLIMYPARLAGIEAEAAPIAEETYRALSENLGVTFNRKIRMYLSDEDEINNGYAVPFKNAYTNMWVRTNDYSEVWTGGEKWLRKIIAHELTHIFHFEATRTNMGLWQYAIANPLPRTWAEGMAQYQTEDWDSQRGDRWLRKAIFDSRLNYNDEQSIENGRLMYAFGNSQLRYFTEKYGDSTLVNLLDHREKFLGVFKYHDFGKAFREVVDGGYSAFYEDWLKHMNVYYYTLASQMERVDSLEAERFPLPGQFMYDAALSPDDSLVAVISIPAISRPVRSLYIVKNDSTQQIVKAAEGRMNPDLYWSRDGKTIYFSRLARGEHSSLFHDIFALDRDTGREARITHNRKARYPAGAPGENQIAYIVNENGTGNLFMYNAGTGVEERITRHEDNIQILWLTWIPGRQSWLFHRFDADGNRNLVLLNYETGTETVIDSGEIDNRKPVLSPDGNQVAYTSLRDEVPNVFIYDFNEGTETRFTNLFTGGEVYGWMAERDTLNFEQLLIRASETKRGDQLHWVNRDRTLYQPEISIPESYSRWRNKQPPVKIPSQVEPDESLVTDRYKYRSFKNLSHAATIALPYYANRNDWGLFATTNWNEPLGKHAFSALGWLSVASPAERSYGSVNYLNNQFYPSLIFSLYRLPERARFYGARFLVEELTGGDIKMRIPLDALETPSYQYGFADFRLRHVLMNPYGRDYFEDIPELPVPESARQTDLQAALQIKKQRPWRDHAIHPLDGYGARLSLTGAEKIFGSETRFLTADLNTFALFPSIGLHRIYAQARFQVRWGEALPQNFIGFSRYDNINLNLPDEVPLQFFDEAERIRGYRSLVAGRQVAFGSLEYRIPLLQSLQTRILGVVDFGSTSLSFFSDAGVVWNARQADGLRGTETRWGAGAEIKNSIRFLGILFSHAIGAAQPVENVFENDDVDLYYRIKAAVPF